MLIAVKIKGEKQCRLSCLTIYRPPKGNINNSLLQLGEVVDALKRGRIKEVLLHGDFNIDYANKSCKWSKLLKHWEINAGLQQLIKAPTRVDRYMSTLIDLCFTDESMLA